MADIVIYGGTFAGVAAAAKAAASAPNKQVVLIVPSVTSTHIKKGTVLTNEVLGGLGTAGGQNYMDIRKYNNVLPEGGTFKWWFDSVGSFYSPKTLSELMKNDLIKYDVTSGTVSKNLTIEYGYDVEDVAWQSSPYKLTSVTARKLLRAATGYIAWDSTTTRKIITGAVFIDASDDGRLARLANFGGSVGRRDWPVSKLTDTFETGAGVAGHQQAATLMFKVKDFAPTENPGSSSGLTESGLRGSYGGIAAYTAASGAVRAFNEGDGKTYGYALKPFNVAEAEKNSGQYWVNALLIFNVDGRACERDRLTSFPADFRTGAKTVDEAWVGARKFLKDNIAVTSQFMKALRSFPGFANATIVTDNGLTTGNPIVGDALYLRETIHVAGTGAKNNGTENTNYALTATACHKAGTSSSTGSDTGNYATRIGLGYYLTDINAYRREDLLKAGTEATTKEYIWGSDVALKLRSDMSVSPYLIDSSSPQNPVYVPFSAILNPYVSNMLVPGYAANMGSFAWAEMRVLPNLAMMGDAAGVAAAYAANNNKAPFNFVQADITAVQNTLKTTYGARLDK